MSSPMDELCAGLVEAISNELGCPVAAVELAVAVTTAGWKVRRVEFPNTSQHPGEETVYGHVLEATLPFVPENDTERADREASEAAFFWALGAQNVDPDDVSPDDELGPPPQRVGTSQLLGQCTWWRGRERLNEPDQPMRLSTHTVPMRLADMRHDHRLSLLGWLRRHAEVLKLRADWKLASTPGPSGDMACDGFERACAEQWETPDAEWIEDQPLVRALVRWTTPWAESPLTWRPINYETPETKPIMVRFAVDSDEEPTLAMRTMQYGWTDLHYVPLDADPAEWRDLYERECCPHDVPLVNGQHIEYCPWCDHGHDPGYDENCEQCREALERMDY